MKKLTLTFKFKVKPDLRKKKIPKDVILQKYPFLPIRIYFKTKKTPIIEAICDSGADGIYFPREIADVLSLPKGKKIESEGICGKFQSFETKVGFIIGRGGNEVDFGIVKAVYPEAYKDEPILIGRSPLFEEFQIIFEEFNEKFKLVPKEDILKKR